MPVPPRPPIPEPTLPAGIEAQIAALPPEVQWHARQQAILDPRSMLRAMRRPDGDPIGTDGPGETP